jgi:hypothetical protein
MYQNVKRMDTFFEGYHEKILAVFSRRKLNNFFFSDQLGDFPLAEVHLGSAYAVVGYLCGLLHGIGGLESIVLDRSAVAKLESCAAFREHPVVRPFPGLSGSLGVVEKLWNLVEIDMATAFAEWSRSSDKSQPELMLDLNSRVSYLRYLMSNVIASYGQVAEPRPLQVTLMNSHAWTKLTEPDLSTQSLWIVSP